MGSSQSNTSWCWSPRERCPEHVPPIPKKSYEELMEEDRQKKWWDENKWTYIEGKAYDNTDNDWNN
jgi:hypothetical protein